jgi:hypothetical protein
MKNQIEGGYFSKRDKPYVISMSKEKLDALVFELDFVRNNRLIALSDLYNVVKQVKQIGDRE